MRWERLERSLPGLCRACGPLVSGGGSLWRLGERRAALPPVRPPRPELEAGDQREISRYNKDRCDLYMYIYMYI